MLDVMSILERGFSVASFLWGMKRKSRQDQIGRDLELRDKLRRVIRLVDVRSSLDPTATSLVRWNPMERTYSLESELVCSRDIPFLRASPGRKEFVRWRDIVVALRSRLEARGLVVDLPVREPSFAAIEHWEAEQSQDETYACLGGSQLQWP